VLQGLPQGFASVFGPVIAFVHLRNINTASDDYLIYRPGIGSSRYRCFKLDSFKAANPICIICMAANDSL
jgi:hypothetical protein